MKMTSLVVAIALSHRQNLGKPPPSLWKRTKFATKWYTKLGNCELRFKVKN